MIPGVNATITTYRLGTASNKETYSGTATLTSVECYLEQLDWKVAVILDDANAFILYQAFIDGDANIQRSDKVVDGNGVTYIVKGVKKFIDNEDVENHTEIILTKTNDGT